MESDHEAPSFNRHHSAETIALMHAALEQLKAALVLIDQYDDQICGAHVQTAVDGLTMALSERPHDND